MSVARRGEAANQIPIHDDDLSSMIEVQDSRRISFGHFLVLCLVIRQQRNTYRLAIRIALLFLKRAFRVSRIVRNSLVAATNDGRSSRYVSPSETRYYKAPASDRIKRRISRRVSRGERTTALCSTKRGECHYTRVDGENCR